MVLIGRMNVLILGMKGLKQTALEHYILFKNPFMFHVALYLITIKKLSIYN